MTTENTNTDFTSELLPCLRLDVEKAEKETARLKQMIQEGTERNATLTKNLHELVELADKYGVELTEDQRAIT